ncbi:MAG: hypothetical protein WAM58_22800 [Candidatus Acidiferrum sp.]
MMSGIERPRQVFVPLIGVLFLLFGAIGSFGRQASIPNPRPVDVGKDNGHSNVVAPQPQATQESSKTPSAKAADADYVGSETCKTCHEELYKGWEKSAHWKQTYEEGGIGKHGCEDCHGAGAAHVAGRGDVSKIFVFGKIIRPTKLIAAALPATRAAQIRCMP